MSTDNFIFTSQRLGFRLLSEDDVEDYLKLDSNPEVRKFFPNGTLDRERVKNNIKKNIEFYKSNGFGVLVAIELESGEFVGRCGFGAVPTGEIEVGYVFLPKFWGKGLATEAVTALLDWANQNIHVTDRIIAYADEEHLASLRVMEKVGMRFYKKDVKDGQACCFYEIDLKRR